MSGNQILILGGGVGGLVASNELADRLGDNASVTLIERKRGFSFRRPIHGSCWA
ncbi:MAG: NAD(P)-binding protein [Conexivisphaerales archaeon]